MIVHNTKPVLVTYLFYEFIYICGKHKDFNEVVESKITEQQNAIVGVFHTKIFI